MYRIAKSQAAPKATGSIAGIPSVSLSYVRLLTKVLRLAFRAKEQTAK